MYAQAQMHKHEFELCDRMIGDYTMPNAKTVVGRKYPAIRKFHCTIKENIKKTTKQLKMSRNKKPRTVSSQLREYFGINRDNLH